MENKNLQNIWNSIGTEQKNHDQLRTMLQEKNHPTLKRIRRQLIIECIGFTVFGLLYYTAFDGHQKPLYGNMALVTAGLIAIAHSLYGYMLARNSIAAPNIKIAVTQWNRQLKTFATISILTRITWAAGLLVFFSSVVTFNAAKYCLLGVAVAIFIIQIILLISIWRKRLNHLDETIRQLTT